MRSFTKKAALRTLFCLLTVVIVAPRSLVAQLPDSVSSGASISLVTVTPGTMVYNVFGHSAVRVLDPLTGLDALFNYGTFDVTPSFVPDFIRGKLDYSLSVSNTAQSIRHYQAENRSVIEQHLRLSTAQVQALYEYLRINYLPDNRHYRYDFFFDNCSTRIRDAFQSVLGDSLIMPSLPQEESFRDLLHGYLTRRPFLETGIDVIIGSDADQTASTSERTFLPLELAEQLDVATLGNFNLVVKTDTIFVAETTPGGSSRFWPLLSWLVLIGGLVVTYRNQRAGSLRRTDAFLFLTSGLAGIAILLLWFGTDHVVTDANLNITWLLPTNLAIGLALLRNRQKRWQRFYLMGYALIIGVVVIGWFFWFQDLPDLLLPLALLLLVRAVARSTYNGLRATN